MGDFSLCMPGTATPSTLYTHLHTLREAAGMSITCENRAYKTPEKDARTSLCLMFETPPASVSQQERRSNKEAYTVCISLKVITLKWKLDKVVLCVMFCTKYCYFFLYAATNMIRTISLNRIQSNLHEGRIYCRHNNVIMNNNE